MILSLQPQKADSFRFAPPSRKTGVLKAFLGYVRSSDVIENGRVVKERKYEKLMEESGLFAQLMKRQMA
jgi:hypothetical protein